MSAAPARCSSRARRPTARTPPSGPRSTPAWSRRPALDGQEVVTSEGLGAPDDLHPVQHEMAVRGGSQCGYCTPGFVCSMAAEFYRAGRAATNGSGRPRTTPTTATTASTCTRSAATCAAAPATGRSRTPRSRSASRPPTTGSPHGVRRPRRPPYRPGCTTARRRSSARPICRGPPAPRRRTRGHRRRRQHRLGRRRQPQGRAGPGSSWPSTGSTSCAAGRVDDDEIRIGAALTLTEVERRLDGRLPLLAAAVPAVRLAADPQRRHPRRQPRHRLADRRRAAGAARPGGERRPRLGRRDADGAAERLLHRLPRVRTRARRADHRGRRAAAGRRPRRRSTRSPSAPSTTSRRWPSASRSTSPTAR